MPSVRTICSVDLSLIESYPLHELEWTPNREGICGMIENPPRVEEFFELVKGHFPSGKLGMNMVSKVIHRQVIPFHSDRHDNDCKTRIHIPLQTNPDAWFMTHGVAQHINVGGIYVIDPSVEHGVVNMGKEDRIHLIFNVVQ